MNQATYVEGFHSADRVGKMQYRPLGATGLTVSVLGLGGSALGSVFGAATQEDVTKVVHEALHSGINLVDTSPWYGNSQEVLGKALKRIPRQSFYISTKAGRYRGENGQAVFDFRAETVTRSMEHSLSLLGLTYVDFGLIHDIEFCPDLDIIVNETLPAMQRLKDEGKIRFIGLSALPLSVVEWVIERSRVKVDVVLSYCRFGLHDQVLMSHLAYMASHGVGLISAAPLAMGLHTVDGPSHWHPADDELKATCARASAYCTSQGVNISRLALSYVIQNDRIPTTLVSTSHPSELQANLQAIWTPLNSNEQRVLHVLLSEYFGPLGDRHWEGKDPEAYFKEHGGREALLKTIYGR